jgi:hypothetical protein
MVDVELSQLIPAVISRIFSDEMMERVLDDVADGARAKWISLARRELTSSKEEYIRGIQPVEAKAGERIITLVGWLPNAIEKGIGGYDMRMTLLGPGKGNRSASGGYYRSIPFRHSGAGSAGLAGTPAGSQYGPRGPTSLGLGGLMSASSAREMGENVMQAARRLKASKQAQPGARTAWGARLKAGMAPKLSPHHATDIFAGMVRVRHTYRKGGGTKNMTFRTISTDVSSGWQHPGIQGVDLMAKVEEWVSDMAPRMFAAALRGIGR